MDFFRIEAAYCNEGERYGEEVFYVEADGPTAAEALGREAATQSKYDDPRIPDRHIEFEAERVEREDIPDETLVYRQWPTPTP